MCLQVLLFKVLTNLPATADFCLLRVEYISWYCHGTMTSMICCKTHSPDFPICFLVDGYNHPETFNHISDWSTLLIFRWNSPWIFAGNINIA